MIIKAEYLNNEDYRYNNLRFVAISIDTRYPNNTQYYKVFIGRKQIMTIQRTQNGSSNPWAAYDLEGTYLTEYGTNPMRSQLMAKIGDSRESWYN